MDFKLIKSILVGLTFRFKVQKSFPVDLKEANYHVVEKNHMPGNDGKALGTEGLGPTAMKN